MSSISKTVSAKQGRSFSRVSVTDLSLSHTMRELMAKHDRGKDKKQIQLEISTTRKKYLQTNKSVSGIVAHATFFFGGGGITGTKLMSGRDTVLEKKSVSIVKFSICSTSQNYLFQILEVPVMLHTFTWEITFLGGRRDHRFWQMAAIRAPASKPRGQLSVSFFFFARWDFLTSAVRRSA